MSLCKQYGTVQAVKGVSLWIGRGEVFAFLGRYTDRVAIIDHGQIVATSTPDELKHKVGADTVGWLTVLARLNPLTYAVAPLRSVVFAAQHLPSAAAAKFSSNVTLFGYTLSNATCIGITCGFAVAFLAPAVTGFGKPD